MYINVIGVRSSSARDAQIMQDTIQNHCDPVEDAFNYFFEDGIVRVPGIVLIVGIARLYSILSSNICWCNSKINLFRFHINR